MGFSGEAAAAGIEAFREGIKDKQKRRQDFEDRVAAALVEESIRSRRTKSVYDIDESGNLRSLGNVPEGAQVIRDRQLSPLDQLRQNILTTQRDVDQPGLLEARINQLASVPGSEQEIGGLQQQFGQSVLKQQQAKAQLPLLQQQAQALQEAGLLSPSLGSFGGFEQLGQDFTGSQSSIPLDFPDASTMEEGTIARDPSSGGVYQVVNGAWIRIK